jgi:hypothetical protein
LLDTTIDAILTMVVPPRDKSPISPQLTTTNWEMIHKKAPPGSLTRQGFKGGVKEGKEEKTSTSLVYFFKQSLCQNGVYFTAPPFLFRSGLRVKFLDFLDPIADNN